jgi:hypothetical protein
MASSAPSFFNSTAEYLVGARRVCFACRERGLHIACARCDRPTLDLADAADRSTLMALWSGGRAFEAGLGLWSLRNVRLARRLRNATVLTMVVIAVGAGGAALHDARFASASAVSGILIGVVLSCFLFAPLLAVFFLVYANVLRILGLIFEILRPVVSAAPRLIRGSLRLRFGVLRTLFWWMESALLPRITLSPVLAAAGPEKSGTLVAPLTLSLLVDEAGWLWCTDAIVPPFALRTTDDQPIEVEVGLGAVKIPFRLGERVSAPGEAAPWLTPPPRGRRFQRILPVGTRVRLSGGEGGDTLCGTSRAPLIVAFGEGA